MGLQQQLTSTLGGIIGSGGVQLALRIVLLYIVVLWIAAAFWAYRDMSARSDHPAMPYLAAAIVILATPILFPFGLLVYRIVRPGTLAAERRHEELSQALLMSEIGEVEQCAGCRRKVESDWMVCPNCRTELREHCANCRGIVEFDWLSCAWCGRDLGRLPEPVEAMEPPARVPVRLRDRDREPVPVMDEEAAASGQGWSGMPAKVAMASPASDAGPRPRNR